MPIRQSTLAKNLQEQIKNTGVSLFEFVQQNHGKWIFTHLASQQSLAIAKATDQPRRTVWILVFTHVETNHLLLVAIHELSQGLGHLCFPDASRANEHQAGDGATRTIQIRFHDGQQIDNQIDRFWLANNPLGKPVASFFKVERHAVVQQESWQAGFVGKGVGHAVGIDRLPVLYVFHQVAKEANRPARHRRIRRVPGVQLVDGRDGGRVDRFAWIGHFVCGNFQQDLASLASVGRLQLDLMKCIQHLR